MDGSALRVRVINSREASLWYRGSRRKKLPVKACQSGVREIGREGLTEEREGWPTLINHAGTTRDKEQGSGNKLKEGTLMMKGTERQRKRREDAADMNEQT